jgi:hypothetical protein
MQCLQPLYFVDRNQFSPSPCSVVVTVSLKWLERPWHPQNCHGMRKKASLELLLVLRGALFLE